MKTLGLWSAYFFCFVGMLIGCVAFAIFDRDDEEWIVAPLFLGGGLLLFVFFWLVDRSQRRDALILRTGVPGQATVLTVKKTSAGQTEARYLKLTLAVQFPDRPPCQVMVRKVYGLSVVDRIQPGLVVPVRVHPSWPKKVRIATDVFGKPLA